MAVKSLNDLTHFLHDIYEKEYGYPVIYKFAPGRLTCRYYGNHILYDIMLSHRLRVRTISVRICSSKSAVLPMKVHFHRKLAKLGAKFCYFPVLPIFKYLTQNYKHFSTYSMSCPL